ncbi:cysteine--1-D-myo-inosityl 2-amino-2-deoxy-alpha-D-glucopyranoside ligase [Tessaracoccus antarcticus]|uniref:L-cysteine:1D-myo-inositol 2-amino-2-deoxy-alpha-D-glucopyranoside ligase n=1 Tax=Tessaracoccus antarcticus TaxID=2479848 RepID=A0A3M0FYP3_9ACTN|nr:cysteine--1-D-myo-inosityl 2-amino-2-deoxy-alpha-D-glucopyranoside ligase [Tessaracoccus antarcticus]RMB57754.1 cysteine--1-D-myo-inosityl 2-amino-2-deoxy-alpha-D-glucopyranoside ligase [Tessaracoccus antarcticus]
MYAWPKVDVPLISHSGGDVPDRLSLHDTATRELVAIEPDQDEARMYVCGITPYDATHLGHANTYVAFDLVNRVWRDLGLDVNYTQNVTDVDDPLLERAEATGQDWEELAESQIELFRSDMTDLRVIPPDHYVGAVETISCVVEVIEQLLPSGLVYQVEDAEHPDWYFNSAAAPGFGGVSNLEEAEMLSVFAERGGDPERPGKRHPLDSLLWQFAREGEPSWESPLGAGRPGWHIECVAISLRFLGPHFDVQGGGSDLTFPHHEMCAAQAIVASREPMAKAFVHSGMVALGGEKMSKSKGNLELVSRLRHAGADPMAIRLALLDQHYRSDWEWEASMLEKANERLHLWRSIRNNGTALPAAGLIDQLRKALRTDLDAPSALQSVDAWVAGSLAVDSDDTGAIHEMEIAVDALLGIKL